MVLQLDSWGHLFLKLVLPPLQYPDQMPATRTKTFSFPTITVSTDVAVDIKN